MSVRVKHHEVKLFREIGLLYLYNNTRQTEIIDWLNSLKLPEKGYVDFDLTEIKYARGFLTYMMEKYKAMELDCLERAEKAPTNYDASEYEYEASVRRDIHKKIAELLAVPNHV
ncbi:hypothetical protein GMAR_ORF57 [Golden Marseillevirus]|uniref:hypothetical protein n=1 Tax=Golden Marseillevirus TaxID=1720526 RepID=UPI000877AAC9|nr:hypothetical protein GMAR_ORF57 [Golden Marseillevirus]ALX27432.1 hypothetical protein GMAR_ORF57 [Golden Marseillevirus]